MKLLWIPVFTGMTLCVTAQMTRFVTPAQAGAQAMTHSPAQALSIGAGATFQISRQYSRIARSEEK